MNLAAIYIEAWKQPRQSMHRILSLELGERDRLIMVAVTGVLFAIPMIMIFRAIEMPPGPDGEVIPAPSALMTTLTSVMFVIFGYYFTAALIKIFGTLFGGTASYQQSKSVSAWVQFVVGLANLALMMASFVLPSFLDGVVRVAFTLAALYVTSAYVAEAHGFAHISKVAGVSIAIVLVAAIILMMMMPSGGIVPA